MTDPDIPLTYAATATAESARRMARAMWGWGLRQTRLRVSLLVVLVLLSGVVFAAYAGDGLSPVARLVGSLFWAAPLTVAVLGIVSALGWSANLRNFRQPVPAGAVQQTGFGEVEFVTANALSSSRFRYEAVRSIDRQGEFVIVRFVGSPVVRVYPESLFPADVMDRLRGATSPRR